MTRTERRNAHKKQEKLQIKHGTPSVAELIEGVPVLRFDDEDGVAEYIKFKGVMYKNVFTRL